MNNEQRVIKIKEILTATFQPDYLDVIDESYKHKGHPGAQDGRGHFAVCIKGSAFANQSPIARHRMIYQALGTLLETDIHALKIDARS